jgi:Extensin-like protein C-terminus
MRYDVDFEAEPFQGYTEFDEAEWEESESESESESEWPGELEWEGEGGAGAGLAAGAVAGAAGLPGVVSQPFPQRSKPTNIRCPPGVTKTCPAIPNMLKVTSIGGVGFEYVLGKGGITKGTNGLWAVRQRSAVKQNFTPEVVRALMKFLGDMRRFGMEVEAILTGGSYYCRCISKSSNLSNHSFGDAIDVVGIRWRGPSGTRETIVHNYANPQERAVLRRINACLRLAFATVIDYHRSDHRDHFHCDTNRGRGRNVLGQSAVNFIRESLNLVLKLGLPEAGYRKLDAAGGLGRVSGRTREQLKNKQVLTQTVDTLFTRVAQG